MEKWSMQIQRYLDRIRETDAGTEVLCKHCSEWKPSSGFHIGKGKYKSMCKACHSSRYNRAAGYESPTAKAKRESAHARKQVWLTELQECTICGEVKERRLFFSAQQKRYMPYCCSPRRTHEQIEADIAEQMKTCFECGLRLPFDSFSYAPNGRDKKKPYCKCCVAAIMHEKSDRPERQRMIDETSDGSVTVPKLSRMLRESENCSHCGVAMTQSYPVKPTQKTIDHNVPLSRGGKHVIENVSIMCLSCNSAKQDRTIEEFSRVKKKMVP
jgi:5-methylcytosine-specific restriction endonuclease McrA